MTVLNINGTALPIKGILFDKDGTLVDFLHTWGHWVELILDRFSQGLQEQGLSPLGEEFYVTMGVVYNTEQGIIDYDRQGPLSVGSVSDLLTIVAMQGYLHGLTWAQALVLANQSQQAANEQLEQEQRVKAMPNLLQFLQQCIEQKLKLAVVTADEQYAAKKHLQWLDLDIHFQAIIGHDCVTQGKPFPDMIHLACEQLQLHPSEVVMIGDTNGDMLMAQSAGVQAAIAIVTDETLPLTNYSEANFIIYSYQSISISPR
ncbi:HAD family hydrolase [Paenibacillus endoradicis]|uniref:HAD family hydrolase n=1 Tax=Paenibacillus endoradicis TaxID=2972487 RepID=UPI00215991F4|nr:HAD family hydrolase [Paenibacillus endoradicis]MCR8657177.1 HAD family hydrolase [Paenibacillus endoradicis]